MVKPNLKTLYSSDVTTYENRVLRYKDFTFPYGPMSIDVSEDSRMAEYNYLFTDGIELTKVRGRTIINIRGILVPGYLTPQGGPNNPLGLFPPDPLVQSQYTEAYRIFARLRQLANGLAGVLVTPGLGVYNTAYLTKWSFQETGENQRNLEYTLEFTITNIVPPATRIPTSLEKKQADVPDVDKVNVAYTIQSGDTLSAIAARFNVSLVELKAHNPNLFDARHRGGNLIFPGEIVQIIKGGALTEKPKKPAGTGATTPKTTTVKNSNDIPRQDRATTYIANKEKLQQQFDSVGVNYYNIPTGARVDVVPSSTGIQRDEFSTINKYRASQGLSPLISGTPFPMSNLDYNPTPKYSSLTTEIIKW